MKLKWGLIAGFTAVVAIPVLVGTVSVVRFGSSDRICEGVTVSGVAIGGLPKSAASQTLQSWARDRLAHEITLTALDTRWSGTVAGFGTRIDWQHALDKAYAVGRNGSVIERAICTMSSGGKGKRIKAPIVMNQVVLEKTLAKVAKAVNRPHKDARLKVVDGRLEITPDSCGIKLNEKRAVKVISDAMGAGNQIVPLPVAVDRPDVTAEDAKAIDTLLARYTTPFNSGNRSRTHNLTLAAHAIDGVVLRQGGEFSYNDIVGPRVTERGYKNAIVFVRGKMEEGVGGGICQVSSTLYNSVLLAGLDVTARRPHSRTVPYVTPGRDATVAYGLQDFRFKNSNSSAVGLISTVKGSRLTVDIYGSAKDKKNIEIFTSKAKYSPFGEKTITDASLSPGARKVVDKGSSGVSVIVYRKVTDASGKSVTEVVSRDKYAAQARIVAVGPRSVQAEAGSAVAQPEQDSSSIGNRT